MHRCARAAVVAGTAATLVAAPALAWADFAGVASAGTQVTSGTLAAPTGMTLAKKCYVLGLGSDTVTVNWTPTTSAAATGYQVTATPGSGSAVTASVGRGTTTATLGIKVATTYSVTVAAVVGGWTAPAPAQSVSCSYSGT